MVNPFASLLPPLDHVRLDTIDGDEQAITVTLSVTTPTAGCPDCAQLARRVHSGYQRTLADLPWAGRPVRLSFRREESSACSEMVVFGDFGKSAKLPEGELVPVEFLPKEPGTYEFTCQMGMLRGRLVVEPAR